MKLTIFVAVLMLLAVNPASASLVTLDFEGPSSFASIADFYNGGTDSDGVAGPDLGVTFGLDDLALQNDVLGPYFSNAPSPLGVMAPVGPETALNFVKGFDGVSFYYSVSDDVTAGVQVWSGLNGTGKLLASFDLAKNAEADGPDRFSQWDQLSSGPLSQIGHSMTFNNTVTFGGFDDVSLSAVPEPTSAVLAVLGFAGVVLMRWRRSGGRTRKYCQIARAAAGDMSADWSKWASL